jgi:hypothetical protein
MHIGGLMIVALVLFVIVMVMLVKTCSIMSCTARPDSKTGIQGDVESGGEK